MNANDAFSKQKLAELVLFFAEESQEDRFFGSTKLNKLLFLADFWSYAYLGESITGTAYIHQLRGPTPKPDQFLPVRDQLIDSERLEIALEDTYTGTRKRPVPRSDSDQTLFTEKELNICRDALEALRHMTASESRDWSHEFLGWRFTEEGEEIPYESAYLWKKNALAIDDIQWAMSMASDLEEAGNADQA